MTYSIIQPPFTLDFQRMLEVQLQAYASWFHEILPHRLEELSKAVRSTTGFEAWQPNLAVESLDSLGVWFAKQVQTRQKTEEEIGVTRMRMLFPTDIPTEELTNRTFSLAMDIGMYFAQVVQHNLPGTRWDQPLKDKKFADYGQPVLMGFGSVPLNPVRVVVTAAYGIARKQLDGSRLRGLYDTWASMRSR